MKLLLTTLLLFCLMLTGRAQIITGDIKNEQNEAIPNATLYIEELKKGVVTNDAGEFRIKIEQGRYHLSIRALGYKSQTKTVEINDRTTPLHIILAEETYHLKEVEVSSSRKEDPAYQIMRKVIAMAPAHLHSVEKYESESYLKGNFFIREFPKFLAKKVVLYDDKTTLAQLIGHRFTFENSRVTNYSAPDNYEVQLKASRNTLPDEIVNQKGMYAPMKSNIYAPKFAETVSPVAPDALAYYKYKFEGVISEEGTLINIIKVEAKIENENLLNGYLYIVEDSWNVYRAILSQKAFASIVDIKIDYQRIYPNVYLPITYDIKQKVETIGLDVEVNNFVSIKYNTISLNPLFESLYSSSSALTKEAPLHDMLQVDDLTTKQAKKTAKRLSKQLESSASKEEKKSLEIKQYDNYTLNTDSFAHTRDSLFWESVRVVPLTQEEAHSLQMKDSIYQEIQKEEEITTAKKRVNQAVELLLLGSEFKINKKFSLTLPPLLLASFDYQMKEDGLWLGQSFQAEYRFNSSSKLKFEPMAYYALRSKKWAWWVNTRLEYAPKRNGLLSIALGKHSQNVDITNQSSFILGRVVSSRDSVYHKLYYNRKHLHIENSIDLLHGLQLTAGLAYEEAIPNDASNLKHLDPIFLVPFEKHKTARINAALHYTPRHFYSIYKGKKYYLHSNWPTIGISYRGAIPLTANRQDENWSNYHSLELSLAQNITVSHFENIQYHVKAGGFLSSKQLTLPEYRFFATESDIISIGGFFGRFNSLESYRYSTKQWLEAHFEYKNSVLLLGRIPFLKNVVFDERVHAAMFVQEARKPFVEAGYSVSLLQAYQAGIFVGGDAFNNRFVQFKMSILLPSM